MARTVEDTALILNVIADNSLAIDKRLPQAAYQESLKGTRIGVARNYFGLNSDVDNLIDNAIHIMKEAGAVIIDTTLETKDKFDDAEFEVLLYEFKDGINRYLSNCSVVSGIKTLK